MTISYVSTRGQSPKQSFDQILTQGTAPDGGLYVPDCALPQIDFAGADSYFDFASKLLTPFFAGSSLEGELDSLVQGAYSSFNDPIIAFQNRGGITIAELFHGPSLAFKDFALQLLARVMNAKLKAGNERRIVITATSGDTGAAAVAAFGDLSNVDLVVLFPKGRISSGQRQQIVATGKKLLALEVEGTFDDCQSLVKRAFASGKLKAANKALSAANSIHWLRVLAQSIYYCYIAAKVDDPEMRFVVPTGNFGNMLACYYAQSMNMGMGSKNGRSLVACNENDILHRFFFEGDYSKQQVKATHSPAMDIQAASNFERLLYCLTGSGETTAALLKAFGENGFVAMDESLIQKAQQYFESGRTSEAETLATMQRYFKSHGYNLDPHTAVAVFAAEQSGFAGRQVVLSTAHPAKFPEAFLAAGLEPVKEASLEALVDQPAQVESLPAIYEALEARLLQL